MSASLALSNLPDHITLDAVSSLAERETVPTWETEQPSRAPRVRVAIRFGGGVEPRWLKSVTAQLNRILQLEEGWDSYGAKAIKLEAVSGMIKLLARMGTDVVPPTVFPAPDGGIQLEWNTPAGSLEIKLLGEDRVGFFAEEPGGIELEEEGISQATFISEFYQKIKHLIPRG